MSDIAHNSERTSQAISPDQASNKDDALMKFQFLTAHFVALFQIVSSKNKGFNS